ncbi:MAG: helix-turn-helix domain-containing protein [Pirellulales bacterium]
MSTFVTLEEAAKKLGVSTDQLIEMRSRGEIFGYRDGASWKFKPEEIERVASEMMGDVLDEDPAGSSILSLDPDPQKSGLGSALSGMGSGSGLLLDGGSDITLQVDPQSSDIRLVANSDLTLGEPTGGSGLSQVDESGLKLAKSDDDDDELSLAIEDSDEILSDVLSGSSPKIGSGTGSDAKLKMPESAHGSDVALGSDALSGLNLSGGSELSLSDDKSGLIRGDSDPAIKGGSSGLGSDLNLADDLQLEDDLVLGGGSDLALAADSGINLMSPADSGISLEDEPLDLAASGISGLDLALEGSDAGSSGAGSGIGSGVNLKQDEDFQLSPSGGLENDDDSGSQVIELEDSSEFGDAAVAIPDASPMDAFADMDAGDGFDANDAFAEMAPSVAGPGAVMASPEVPFGAGWVSLLVVILMILSFSGIILSDISRNLWAWSGNETANSLTSGISSALTGKK